MASFCTKCGRPLVEGEACICSRQSSGENAFSTGDLLNSTKGFWESMKNRMGIGDPDLNKGDAFENGKRIIPDCVKANEGEIPVKQYKVATLRNRILGIPYTKAVGRVQVTNKRVIFRAPGRCMAGRTTLQHEFAIDEIAGVEARREYVFNFWDLLFSIYTIIAGLFVTSLILGMFRYDADVARGIFGFIFGVAGCVPFFMIKKKWYLKLLCLGASLGGFFGAGVGFFTVFGLISLVLTVLNVIITTMKPNLVMIIKTKGATEAIDIKRKKKGLFQAKDDKGDHTGYAEVIPADDVERCIREIDAMINDIQKLGDFGIEKWKA